MKLSSKCIILVLVLEFTALCSGFSLVSNEYSDGSLEEIREKWTKMESKLKLLMSSSLEKIFPTIKATITDLNVTAECKAQNRHLLIGLQNYKPWAMRFLDSSGKIVDGMMVGTFNAIGSYDECLDTVAISDNKTEGSLAFKGQYCSMDFRPLLPSKNESKQLHHMVKQINYAGSSEIANEIMKYPEVLYYIAYRIGFCIPSGCTTEDADKIARYMGDSMYIKGKVNRCETREGKSVRKLPPIGIFAVCFYATIFLLLIIGSSMDLYGQHKNKLYTHLLQRILLSFSFFNNFKKLMSVESKSHLSCLNGIRFLGMAWIVLTHGYFIMNIYALTGMFRVREVIGQFAFQPIVNGTFAVDSFFFVGGLVSCYVLVKNVKLGSHRFSIPMYIFHRLWRIMPLYIALFLFMFTAGLLDLGPLWPEFIEEHIDVCYTTWWRNLLFINNFSPYESMCMQHSWYLACDFQLYLMALLILIPLFKSSVAGVSLTILGILTSVIYSMVATYINKFPPAPTIYADLDKVKFYMESFFNSPIIHLGAYCVGLLTGYILAVKPKIQIPKAVQVAGWCLSFACNFSIMYGTVNWNRGREPLLIESTMYGGLARTGWAVGLAWIVTCCATGHGGIIDTILSWSVFVPLARLSFATYLVHPFVEGVLLGSTTTLIPTSNTTAVWAFFGHLCISIGFAFVVSMMIEAPFLSLEKIILGKKEKPLKVKDPESPIERNGQIKNVDQIVKEQVFTPDFSANTTTVENKEVISKL